VNGPSLVRVTVEPGFKEHIGLPHAGQLHTVMALILTWITSILPEPVSIILLGSLLIAITVGLRRKSSRSPLLRQSPNHVLASVPSDCPRSSIQTVSGTPPEYQSNPKRTMIQA
jgi:hypothetical protein